MFSATGPVYYLNGAEVSREEFKKVFPEQKLTAAPGGQQPGTWPQHSDALGVHPDQIPEAAEVARRHGVPTNFDADGCAVLTGPAHRKKLAELYGFFDKNGGYGDPQRK